MLSEIEWPSPPEVGQQPIYLMSMGWNYDERNDLHPVLPGLLVGPYTVTRRHDVLQHYGVTHVLCIRDPQEVRILNRSIEGLENQFMDVPANVAKENIIQHFDLATEYIEKVLSEGGRILVCCADGIDKGPAFAAAYLMRKYALRAVDSIVFMQNRRYCSCPSPRGYRVKLLEYEPICQARRQFEGNVEAHAENARRRAAEDDIGVGESVDGGDVTQRRIAAPRRRIV